MDSALHGESQSTATDPVCGMEVEPTSAAGTHEHDGQTYFFCSAHCLERFRAEPARYLGPATQERKKPGAAGDFTCPMHPEVHQTAPGSCPSCGMALEPAVSMLKATKTEYVCPMHPEIVRDEPGSCPICGMALEPRTISLEEEVNPELVDMTRRFWISLVLAAPLVILAMAEMIPGQPVQRVLGANLIPWIQLVLATPVVLWGGWPFFQRGWASIVNRSLNMFTLIAL
ncbi:MAG: heavy metal-binding domain-containing protein, partial [Nitrospirota bacterium]|nr:heavy metal-binding domain-containing protein [Nitrospirota bacterium]